MDRLRRPLPKFVLKTLKGIGNDRYLFWSGNGKLKTAVADWQRLLCGKFTRLTDVDKSIVGARFLNWRMKIFLDRAPICANN